MAQSILEQAKQGDPQAIANLINRSLQPRGISATATLENDCLQLVLQSSQALNQKAVVSLIQRGMLSLQVESIKKVNICARKSGSNFVGWNTELNLSLPDQNNGSLVSKSGTSEALVMNQNASSAQSITKDERPKGIIVMDKVAQLKHVSQEYQDIIIRFIDENYGTVKCLATLTELIQAINKSSFSFSSVASNANLRTLLDTIAECSVTDDNGDQVIKNVSILQPGQQWQKVKIRLVTKVFFEPESYVPPAPEEEEMVEQPEVITLDVIENTPANGNSAIAKSESLKYANTTTATLTDLNAADTIEEREPEEDLFAEFGASKNERQAKNTTFREPQSAVPTQFNQQLQVIDSSKALLLDDFASVIGDEEQDEPNQDLLGDFASVIDSSDRNEADQDLLGDFANIIDSDRNEPNQDLLGDFASVIDGGNEPSQDLLGDFASAIDDVKNESAQALEVSNPSASELASQFPGIYEAENLTVESLDDLINTAKSQSSSDRPSAANGLTLDDLEGLESSSSVPKTQARKEDGGNLTVENLDELVKTLKNQSPPAEEDPDDMTLDDFSQDIWELV